MSTYTSDPGTRLGGRYRLEDRLAATGGWSAWKAIDEILARPVSVITFAAGFPRLEQVVTAARAASRLTDTRLTQVFDVEDRWDHGYIVLEWPIGDTLGDLVSDGSIDPTSAARIVAEAAAAVSGAHAAGLAHLCLRPDAIRWTAAGGVKVTGLGIDAALSGVAVDDPEVADTLGLGQLLYAALTGLWPGPDSPDLPPAPQPDGLLPRPGQLRAGIPAALDEIACRALAAPGFDRQAAYQSPAELAAALAAVIPPLQVPAAAPRRWDSDADHTQTSWGQPPTWNDYSQPQPARSQPDWPGRPRRPGRTLAVSLLVVVAVAGASAGALRLFHRPAPPAAAGQSPGARSSPGHGTTVVTPVSASGFDPLAQPGADTDNENSPEAKNVLPGGDPAGWSTQQYVGHSSGPSPTFGNLKAGAGLILDLGRSVRVSSVTVKFGSQPGANVQIKAGSSDALTPANLDAMTTLASTTNVSGSYTFTVRHPVAGQYLVVWFTQLPPLANDSSKYMGQIYSVVVRALS